MSVVGPAGTAIGGASCRLLVAFHPADPWRFFFPGRRGVDTSLRPRTERARRRDSFRVARLIPALTDLFDRRPIVRPAGRTRPARVERAQQLDDKTDGRIGSEVEANRR